MSTNDQMPEEELDAIRERVDAATDGPWVEGERCVFTEDYEHAIVSDSLVEVPGMSPYGEAVQNPADVALIAHAPQDLADLLAEVERLRALTTVDDAMVKRAARAYFEYQKPGELAAHPMSWERLTMTCPSIADTYRDRFRAVLEAALNPGEGS